MEEVGVEELVIGRLAGYDPEKMVKLARDFRFSELARVYVLKLADSDYAWSEYGHLMGDG